MKLIIFYFDYNIMKIFKEQIDGEGKASVVLSSTVNFVCRDEIVAKIIDVEDQGEIKSHIDAGYGYFHVLKYIPIKAGDGIEYNDLTKIYRANEYGFVRFDRINSKISILPPLQISKNKTTAYFLVHPSKLKKIPNYNDISELLTRRNIESTISEDQIEEELNKIDISIPSLHKIIVARGKDPVNGNPEYYLPLVDIEKKAGKILVDGSIDFKEIDSIIQIKINQAVLKKIPAKEPEEGHTIYGDFIPAYIESRTGFIKGKNIVPSNDETVYLAKIDGCINVTNNVISVLPIAVVKGDIDYETGNIDFNGSVEVFGSVLPGFKVTASDNIIIRNNVDDAVIQAGGNVIVHSGIGGKGQTRVIAEGSVNAKYILNSEIEARGEIITEASIINSRVYSNDKITVTHKNGKIMGGEVMALNEVAANTIGGPKENNTIITVGKSRIIERELDNIKTQMNNFKIEVDEITEYAKSMYGESLFTETKKFLSILPEVKKKNCISLLSKLAQSNEKLKEKTEEYNNSVDKYKLLKEPVISIFGDVYPGTVINIKKRTKHIERKYSNVKFFEDNEDKVIKFTYAL